jgi:hypothetical protein
MAVAGELAAAGDVAEVCAIEEVVINVANRIVINDVKVFMAGHSVSDQ